MDDAALAVTHKEHATSVDDTRKEFNRDHARKALDYASGNRERVKALEGPKAALKRKRKRKRKSTSIESKMLSTTEQAPELPTARIAHRTTSRSERTFLITRDGMELEVNGQPNEETLFYAHRLTSIDCIYLVCEPPGEPYYLARIMEFTRMSQDSGDLDAIRVNWFYRPRDIQRQASDTRLLFATMHSEISPLSAIRGKCQILHKSQISDIDAYRRQSNCFYYERLFDKFMRRQYEIIPVDQVTNVPEQVRHVLQRRWMYVVVEINRAKELAMDHRACKRCGDWCASKDSVRCATCKSDFHMQCVQPPLPRKPTRGFAWTCTSCSRAEALFIDPDPAGHSNGNVSRGDDETTKTAHNGSEVEAPKIKQVVCENLLPQPEKFVSELDDQNSISSSAQSSRPELWPFRYLGIHCNVNDAVDHDDRIYPRAASRIGPRYQAAIQDWPGRPIEYFEKSKRPIKRTPKAMKGKRSDERAAMESLNSTPGNTKHVTWDGSFDEDENHEIPEDGNIAIRDMPEDPADTPSIDPATLSASERPPWLQEKPANYLSRGNSQTSQRIWAAPMELSDEFMALYWQKAAIVAKQLRVDVKTPNFMDSALTALCQNNFDIPNSIQGLSTLTRKNISEPNFSPDERMRFEASVTSHGSDLAQVAQDVGTKSVAECVRFYYTWKKTTKGSQIWAKSEARKSKLRVNLRDGESNSERSNDESLGDSSDDSAYSSSKALRHKQSFQCKFCQTLKSTRWHRAPTSTSGQKAFIAALCRRCAELWRKYAVAWEKPEDIYKRLHESGSRGRKRRLEPELLKDLPQDGTRPEKSSDKPDSGVKHVKKVKKVERERKESSLAITLPDPCAVCQLRDNAEHRNCISCRLKVHNQCYGIRSDMQCKSWLCDACSNNKNPLASTVRFQILMVIFSCI